MYKINPVLLLLKLLLFSWHHVGVSAYGALRDVVDSVEEAACGTCPAGQIAKGGCSDGCQDCPAGWWNGGPEKKGLHDRDGHYKSCSACLVGQYSTQNSRASSDVCAPCPTGYVSSKSPDGGSSTCHRCAIGQYSMPKDSRCSACPDGWKGVNPFTDHGKAFVAASGGEDWKGEAALANLPGEPTFLMCEKCGVGYYGGPKVTFFSKFPDILGYYGGKEATNELKTGWETSRPGMKTEDPLCAKCVLGKSTPEKGMRACQPCEPGKAAWNNKTCEDCPLGQFRK